MIKTYRKHLFLHANENGQVIEKIGFSIIRTISYQEIVRRI